MIKGGHQAVGAADAAACEVAGGEIFHHRGGITGGGGACLRVGAGVVRVAVVVVLVAMRVLAEIGGVILRRLGQRGIGAQFLYSRLRPPTVKAFQPRFRFFVGVIMPLLEPGDAEKDDGERQPEFNDALHHGRVLRHGGGGIVNGRQIVQAVGNVCGYLA